MEKRNKTTGVNEADMRSRGRREKRGGGGGRGREVVIKDRGGGRVKQRVGSGEYIR